MTAEAVDQNVVDHLPEAQALEVLLLVILEQHDGLCLDNELERSTLAAALAAALTVNGVTHRTQSSPIEPPRSDPSP